MRVSLVLGRDIRLGKSRLIPFKSIRREREREREGGGMLRICRGSQGSCVSLGGWESKQQTRRSTDGRYPFSIIEFNPPRTALLMADRSGSIERMERKEFSGALKGQIASRR